MQQIREYEQHRLQKEIEKENQKALELEEEKVSSNKHLFNIDPKT